MYIPPLFLAASVFEKNDLDREVNCICGKKVLLRDVLVAFTHPTDTEEYGWYPVCNSMCYTRWVTANSVME